MVAKHLQTPEPKAESHAPATVAAGFVAGLLSALPEHGLDPAQVLVEADLDPDVLTGDSRRVLLTDYALLYNRVVALLQDEGFGLFSAKLNVGTFEFLCRSMIGSRTLAESLTHAGKFLRLVLPDLTLSTVVDDKTARIEIRENIAIGKSPDDPRRVFAFEWLLRLIHGLACWLVARGLSLDSVQFPYPRPPQAADYALIYTEHATFGGDRLIAHLRPNLFALPIRRDQDDLARFLDGAPGKITMLYRRDREMVRQIRDILAASMPEALSIEDIAYRLHVSLRTVQRRLKEEGSSYRAIKSALRRDIALSKIEKSKKSVGEIANELGYAETSAFFRAFVDWTGETPTSYRRRMRSLS